MDYRRRLLEISRLKLNSGPLGALEVNVAHSASEWRQAKAALGGCTNCGQGGKPEIGSVSW